MDIRSITQILPEFAPMQFNTALCFVLIGTSVFLRSSSKLESICSVSAFLAGLIGIMTLAEYLFGANLYIDNLFFQHNLDTATSHLGRMAPNTALCFTLCSLSLLIGLHRKTNSFTTEGVMGILVFGLGATAMVGYFFDLSATYAWGQLTHMAVHTAFGFLLLGLALGLVNWANYLRHALPGNKNTLAIGYIAGSSLVLFFIDIGIPLGVATGSLHVLVLLIAYFMHNKTVLKIFFAISMLMVVLGYFLSEPGGEFWSVLANRIFSLLAITITYWLLSKILNKEQEQKKLISMLDRKIEERTSQLSRRNRELEQLTYISSHDLQEPVRIINTYVDMLTNTNAQNLDELGKRSLGYVQTSAKRIQDLIYQFFVYTRLGKESVLREHDTQTIVEDVSIKLNLHNTKELDLIIHPLPKLFIYKNEFNLLIENILKNAYTYRNPGKKLEIEISARELNDAWEFAIKDNGIGIKKEFHSRIFHLFQRLHAHSEYEGTGIGLSQAQKIVDLHHGEIRVESEELVGSIFKFTIPKQHI